MVTAGNITHLLVGYVEVFNTGSDFLIDLGATAENWYGRRECGCTNSYTKWKRKIVSYTMYIVIIEQYRMPLSVFKCTEQ